MLVLEKLSQKLKVCYPDEIIDINYNGNNEENRFKDLKFFYGENVGEQFLSRIIIYDKMRIYYYSKIPDLRFQIDHKTRKKLGLL